MSYALCQRCQERERSWTVNQAEFHVREVKYWKIQLCGRCAVQVEMVLRDVLRTCPPLAAPVQETE